MTFQPLGLQASDIAALIAADDAGKPKGTPMKTEPLQPCPRCGHTRHRSTPCRVCIVLAGWHR